MGISSLPWHFSQTRAVISVPLLFLLATTSVADQPPNQGFGAAPKADKLPSHQKIASQNPAAGVLVTLSGSGSSDPTGLPLTYTWMSAGSVIGKTPVMQVTLSTPGQYFYTLTVSNGGATATAIATVEFLLDTTPPLVDAPNMTVGFTEDGGARGSASPALHDYLAGA